MNEKKVLVLLSLYNGEKYIIEQLDSLQKQTVPVFILARDDGSTDNTYEIVKKYCEEHKNIKLIKGDNLGFVKSFNVLMQENDVDKYSYVAFCDQDDVWNEDKLEVALTKLKEMNNDVPAMYCSNLYLVDEKLNPIRVMYKKPLKWTKYTCVVQNVATGCTSVFNSKTVQLYRKGINEFMVDHDYFMFLLCAYLGEVYYDQVPHILYRQHDKNVVGGTSKSYAQGIKDIIEDLFKPRQEKRVRWINEFYHTYNALLDNEEKKVLETFVGYKSSLINRLKIFISNKYIGYDFKTTVAFKIRLLIGRMY